MSFLLSVLRTAYGSARRLYKVAALILFATAAQSWAGEPGGEPDPEPVRVMAFGDSLVHGYGLDQGDGFVPQLEAWLNDNGHGPVEVLNMGVSGDTTAGGKARLAWSLGDGADAVIVVLGGNDLLRGLEPSDTRANLAAILTELEGRGIPALLAGMQAPLNYGAEWKAEFDALYPDLAAEHGAILVESFLAPVMEHPEMIQDDGIHPNREGVAAIVGALGPRAAELVERARSE